jgi:hypothetical protein
MAATLYSILESPRHPDFSAVYRRRGIHELRIGSMRKAIGELKRGPPDYIVAEFFYGYGNNYAGVNISNLDVLLYSLQKYAPQARVIVLVDKAERVHVDKLNDILPLAGVLTHPVALAELEALLDAGHGDEAPRT